MGLSIGTLTGRIELEDGLTKVIMSGVLPSLDRVGKAVDNANQHMTRAATVGSFLGNALAGYAMQAVSWTTNLVKGSLMAGVRLEQLGIATRFLGEKAGYSGKYIDELADAIEATGISGIASRESIQSLLGAHIDLEHAAKLSAIAQNMQSLSGRSSSEVFQVMTRALATGNTELLRNIGFQNISIDALTRSSNATTGHTGNVQGAARTQMILNAILAEGADKMGLYDESMKSAGKQLSSSERAWSQVSEQLGKVFVPMTSIVIKAWYKLGSDIRDGVMGMQNDVKGFVDRAAALLQVFIDKARELAVFLVENLVKAFDVVMTAIETWQSLPDIVKNVTYYVIGLTTAAWLLHTAMLAVNAQFIALKTSAFVTGLIALGAKIVFVTQMIAAGGGLTYSLGLLMGPIGWVAVAIAALSAVVYVLYKHWDTIKSVLGPVYTLFENLASLIKSSVILAWYDLKDAVSAVYGWFEKLVDMLPGVDSGLSKNVSSIDKLKNAIINAVPWLRDGYVWMSAIAALSGKNAAELARKAAERGATFTGATVPEGMTIADLADARREYDANQPAPPPGGGGGLSDDQKKAIASLLDSYRGLSKELTTVKIAQAQLTAAEWANYDVLKLVIPDIDKLREAGIKLTATQLAAIPAYAAAKAASIEKQDQDARATGITLLDISAMERAGLTVEDMARQYDLSGDAFERYIEKLKRVESNEQGVASMRAALMEQEAANRKRAEDLALAGHEALATETQKLADMRSKLSKTTTAQQEADIKLWVARTIAGYAAVGIKSKALTDTITAQGSEMSDALLYDVELVKTTSVDALREQAFKAQATYEMMTEVSGSHSEAAIAQAKATMDAAVAAANGIEGSWLDTAGRIGASLGAMFDGINSKLGQVFKIIGTTFSEMAKVVGTEAEKMGQQVALAFGAAAGMISAVAGDSDLATIAVSALSGAAVGLSVSMSVAAATGAQMGLTAGLLGVGIGALVGAIVGLVMVLKEAARRAEENRKAIKELYDETLKTYGGLEKIKALGNLIGVDLFGGITSNSLVVMQALLAEFQDQMALLQNDLEQYGFTWRDLNDQWKAISLQEVADTLEASFLRMERAGVPVDDIIMSMSGHLSQYVVDSITAGQNIPPALQPILTKLIEMGGLTEEAARAMLGLEQSTMPSLASITEAAGRYGMELDDLGPRVQQLRIDDAAAQIVADFNLLTLAGVDFGRLMADIPVEVTDAAGNVTTTMTGMRAEIQELVTRSMKLGLELPASMKPIAEAMIEAGLLTDDTGEKLTDLSQLSFAEDLTTMFEELITKLDELIGKITGGVGDAFDEIGKKVVPPIEVPYYMSRRRDRSDGSEDGPDGSEPDYRAGGGTVWSPRGSDTVPAMLTPGERVLSVAENRASRQQQSVVVQPLVPMSQAGRYLAEILVPELTPVVQEYALG